MPAYFDPSLIDQLTGYLIIDTNVLHSCFTDPKFFVDFMVITKNTQLLIDPIVRLEFMRGAYQENLYAEKRAFLEYDKFYIMTDHYQMYKDLYFSDLQFYYLSVLQLLIFSGKQLHL